MKKVVLKLNLHDDKAKQKALRAVSSIQGIDSISMDMKEQKLTVIGAVDPVTVVGKLRKFFHTEIISVGPAKEPEKKDEAKKEEPKKEEPKKEEAKKEEPKKEEPKKEEAAEKKETSEKKESEKKEETQKKVEPQPQPQPQFYYPMYRHYSPYMIPQEQFYHAQAYKQQQQPPPYYTTPYRSNYYVQSAEENPNACSIM